MNKVFILVLGMLSTTVYGQSTFSDVLLFWKIMVVGMFIVTEQVAQVFRWQEQN